MQKGDRYFNVFSAYERPAASRADRAYAAQRALENNLTRVLLTTLSALSETNLLGQVLSQLANVTEMEAAAKQSTHFADLKERFAGWKSQSATFLLQHRRDAHASGTRRVIVGISKSGPQPAKWTWDARAFTPSETCQFDGAIVFDNWSVIIESKTDDHYLDGTQLVAYAHSLGLAGFETIGAEEFFSKGNGKYIRESSQLRKEIQAHVLDVSWHSVVEALKTAEQAEKAASPRSAASFVLGEAIDYFALHGIGGFRDMPTFLALAADASAAYASVAEFDGRKLLVRAALADLACKVRDELGKHEHIVDAAPNENWILVERDGAKSKATEIAFSGSLDKGDVHVRFRRSNGNDRIGRISINIDLSPLDAESGQVSPAFGLDVFWPAHGSDLMNVSGQADWQKRYDKHMQAREDWKEVLELLASDPKLSKFRVRIQKLTVAGRASWQGQRASVIEKLKHVMTLQEAAAAWKDWPWSFPASKSPDPKLDFDQMTKCSFSFRLAGGIAPETAEEPLRAIAQQLQQLFTLDRSVQAAWKQLKQSKKAPTPVRDPVQRQDLSGL